MREALDLHGNIELEDAFDLVSSKAHNRSYHQRLALSSDYQLNRITRELKKVDARC